MFPQDKSRDTASKNEVLETAVAEPISFPRVEQLDLFLPWLCLCPNAELPIIGNGRMKRLLATSLLGNSRNQGSYHAGYLGKR